MTWPRAALALVFASILPPAVFVDVTATSGISWRHWNGQSADRYLVETTTGGVGVFDFDRDGRLDIFMVNGGNTPHAHSEKPVRSALYRNLGSGKFADGAQQTGVAELPF